MNYNIPKIKNLKAQKPLIGKIVAFNIRKSPQRTLSIHSPHTYNHIAAFSSLHKDSQSHISCTSQL